MNAPPERSRPLVPPADSPSAKMSLDDSRNRNARADEKMVIPGQLTRFSRYFWLTLGMFAAFATAFGLYAMSEKQVDRANDSRQRSYQLADQLRQSSDDLTRMVRTYVVTGAPIYKRHYQ